MSLDPQESLEDQENKDRQGPGGSLGLKVDMETVLVDLLLFCQVHLVLRAKQVLQGFQELQGLQGQEETQVHLETLGGGANWVWVVFQV